MGRMYSLSFTEIGVVAQQDLFQIEAITLPVIIHAVYLSQSSDVGDAASEGLSIIIRSVTDSVPSPFTTGVALDPGDAASTANGNINDVTELTTGALTIHPEAWNILTPFIYLPTPELRPIVALGDTIVVNLNTTPGDSLTMSGALYYEEIGG